jgi:hypothetical protein
VSRRRILYVHSRKASFVTIDREILAERYEVEDLYQPGRWPNPVTVVRGVLRADLVFGWFASWHTFWPVTLAWLLRKPSVMIIGGFDTANMPDIGYGYQQGGVRRAASRWIMRRARRLATNSGYSLSEIERNTEVPPERVRVIHHGVPDPFGQDPGSKEREALTVGAIDNTTLVQKGQIPSWRRRGSCRTFASRSRGSGLTTRSNSCERARARTSNSPAGSRTPTSMPPTGARPCTCRRPGTRGSGWR